jgi:sec1 family domain-containing protein 1
MEMIVSTVVDSLFSVLVTLGTIPVIRCPKNTASEQIAEKLDKKLRENLRDTRNCLFNENNQLNFQRPVLLIIDRNFDLATPLHHTWTYQALIHDTLDLKLNRVEIKEEKKVYDLSCIDKFWSNQKGNPFPQVAEAIQEDLEEYKKKESELTSLKQKMVNFYYLT